MEPLQYLMEVYQRVNAEGQGIRFNPMSNCWCFDWMWSDTEGSVGADCTPELLADIASQEAWIQATVEHVNAQRLLPPDQRERIFGATHEGKYIPMAEYRKLYWGMD